MSLVTLFLRNTITTISSTTTDAFNDATLSTVYEAVPCRWEEVMTEEAKVSGMTKEFGVRCWLLPTFDIKSDYVFLYNGQTYEVVGQEKYLDLSGKHDHTVVYLGFVR